MSYIIRTGNLAATPKLREGDKGPYTFARVIVSDRYTNKAGEWVNGPEIGYDVAVSGDQARRLVACAERDGNVRVTFGGRYRVTTWESNEGPRPQHEVRADTISLSFLGQDAAVAKKDKPAKEATDDAAEGEGNEEPRDIFAEGAGE